MDTTGMFRGVTVLELASVLAGPATGQFFAELGARVIKVENLRGGGDVTRSWLSAGESPGITGYFSCVNWGKESLALDLSTPDGTRILHRLTRQSDIMIVSFKPGAAEKLGADYSTLKDLNRALIYGSVTGYGKNNRRVGYDAVIQAESGFMSINGEPGGPPLKMPVAFIDILAAHQLKQALLLAWIRRMETEEGQEVSVSLFDAAVSSLANQSGNYFSTGVIPSRQGSLHPNIAPYGEVFVTADGVHLLLAVGTDRQFTSLCEILELPGLPLDARFSTNAGRVRHREMLFHLLKDAILHRDAVPFLEQCARLEIPAGRIRTIDEVMNEEGIPMLSSGGFRSIPTFTATSGIPVLSPPPTLGEHSDKILSDLAGMNPVEIDRLRQSGVIS